MRNSPLIICKSHYTFLEGVHSIPEIVNFAVEHGIKALCLADKNGLYGAIEFYILCKEAGIQPMIGAELIRDNRKVTIIAKNLRGYEELSELITRRQLGDFRIRKDILPDSSDLLYICSDTFLLQQWLKKGSPDSLLLGLSLSNRKSFRSVTNLFIRCPNLPRISGVPVLQLNMFSLSDLPLYKVLRAIHHGCTVATLPREELSACETEKPISQPLPSTDVIPYKPVISGDKVAELCHLQFDLRHYHLPKFNTTTE